MRYIPQFFYILLFSLLGELLEAVIPLPVPAALYGLILLLLALMTGILKEEKVSDASSFLISAMPILFVAPVAKLLQHWGLIAPNLLAIIAVMVISTVAVFIVSGLVTKLLQQKKEDTGND